MDLRATPLALVLLLLPVLCHVSGADIQVKPVVNYGSAYRDGSWVPVDVLVTNDDSDIDGWVEVRVIGMTGDAQSPFYRVPATCPRGSRKRFRLHCHLTKSSRIEVRVYHGGRLVDGVVTTREINPIAGEDYLALILDDRITDYGFLTSVIMKQDVKRRVHRENLKNETLGLLADYPQCYGQFNVIVLGDVDPSLIAQRHRTLLSRYVETGGTLVVFTGAHAEKYRGTWVEELAGVGIGSQEIITEEDLARGIFEHGDRAGVKGSRQGVRALLTPRSPDIATLGTDPILATKRPLGRGFVVTMAIDSSSHLLQECLGYVRMWREFLACPPRSQALRFKEASELCAHELPRETGAKIQSRRSVLVYLGLYFFVGIVGNWVVWNHFKRREFAWPCVIFFSLGFTAFAVFFGPAAAGQTTDLTRIQVLHLPNAGNVAELHSFVGIVSSRTSRVSAQLVGNSCLVSDVSASTPIEPYYGRRARRRGSLAGAGELDPFYLVEGPVPGIENLKLRARDLRVIHVSSVHPVSGQIEGSLVLDEKGLRGTLNNQTGIKISRPFLLFKGRTHELEAVGDFLRAELPASLLAKQLKEGSPAGQLPAPVFFPQIGTGFVYSLLLDETSASRPRYKRYTPETVDEALGPFVVGWVDRALITTVRLDRESRAVKEATLVFFDVTLEGRRTDSAKRTGVTDKNGEGAADECGVTQWRLGQGR